MSTLRVNGREWKLSSNGDWLIATDGISVIMERSFEQLKEACSKTDADRPRIDAVAFAELVPGIGSTVGKI